VLVTGTNDGGRSYFQRNQHLLRREVEKSNRVGAYFPAWCLRQLPAFLPNPRDELGELDHADAWEAPPLGVIAGLWELSTNDTPTPTRRPESMDVLFCLSGEAVYVVGDDEVVLQPGDVLIQNGTAHAWHNQGSEETVFGCVSVAAFPLAGGSAEEGARKRS
jgi:mannose-6-phosphate isomerase-like protein (cupin superfamily)